MSTEGAEASLNRLGNVAEKMASRASDAANKAGKAMDGIGNAADESANKLTKAEGRMMASLKRTMAQMEQAGKTASQKFEFQISSKGLDRAVFEPYLAKMRELESAQNRVGISAKQTAAAMQGLPAQLTDIVTSLQGGQAPLTVFLQQGGQLKDMFGGAGNAAKALSGYVVGLINPMTVTATAAAALGLAYYKGSEEAKEFSRSIILTGNASGSSVNHLLSLQNTIAASTGATMGAVAEVLNQITSTGKVSGDAIGFVAEAAIRMERVTGQSVEESVKQFTELGKDPVDASKKLNDQYNYLTAAVYQQIKALDDQGKAIDAANLAQKAYADAMSERSEKIKQSLGWIETGWKAVGDGAKSAWDKMLNIGREQDLETKIKNQVKYIQDLRNGPYKVDTTAAEDYLTKLQIQLEKTKQAASAEAQKNATQREGIAAIDSVVKANEKAMTKQEQMNKALNDYRENIEKIRAADPDSALLDPKKIAATEKSIREQFSDKGAISLAKKEAAELKTLLDRINGESSDFESVYVKNVETLLKAYDKGKLSLGEFNDEFARYVGMQPGAIAAAKELAKVEESRTKAEESRAKYMQSVEDETQKLVEKAKAAEFENSLIGKSADEVARLTSARYDHQIAILEEKAATIELFDASSAELASIKERIAALKQFRDAEITKPKLREQAREWEQFTGQIEQSLTDALYRSFEAGDSFGQAFAKNLENTFKTMLLKFAVQSAMTTGGNLLNTAINAVAGTSGSNDGAGTNYFGLASNASSIYNLASGTYLGYYQAAQAGYGMTAAEAQAAAQAYYNAGYYGTGASIQAGNAVGGAAGSTTGSSAGAGGAATNSAGSMGTIGTAMSAISAGLTSYGVASYLDQKYGDAAGIVGGTLAGAGAYGAGAGIAAAMGGAGLSGSLAAASAALAAIPVWGWAALAVLAIAGSSGGMTKGPWEASGSARFTGSFNEAMNGMTSGATLQDFKREGGWFSSDEKKTEAQKISDSFDSFLDKMYQGIKSKYIEIGNLFDDPYLSDKLVGFSKRIEIADMSNMQSAVESMASQLTEAMGRVLLPSVDAINKAASGESWAQTFERVVNEVNAVNGMFKMLGHTLNEQFGKNNADRVLKLADGLVTLMGGIEQMQTTLQKYYSGYYSQEEQKNYQRDALAAQFEALGLTMPKTRSEFRRLVESMDLATVSGQKTYASLLSIAEAFGVFADSLTNTVDQTSKSIESAISGLFGGLLKQIQDARSGVAGARESIINGVGVMTAAKIRAAITSATPAAPNGNGILAAQDALQKAKSSSDSTLAAAIAARDKAQAAVNERNRGWANRIGGVQVGGWAFNGGEQVSEYNAILAAAGSALDNAGISSSGRNSSAKIVLDYGYQFFLDGQPIGQNLALNHSQDYVSANGIGWGRYNRDLAIYKYKPYGNEVLDPKYDDAVAKARAAGAAAVSAAEDAAIKAQIDYSNAIRQYVVDASKAVDKLSNLRDETVRYYESQQQLIDALLKSASNLREAARLARQSQLSEDALIFQRQREFSIAYSMALSTDGTTQASYADKMAAALPSLVEMMKLKSLSQSDWALSTSPLFSQVDKIASKLESQAAVDYQAESLALLSAIDVTLATIEENASSAEKIISDAVYETGKTTADGLRAVIAAINGETIPAFASGGTFEGGWRIVGERGPELEATGPSRIFNADQTRAIFSGGGVNQALVEEIRALREEGMAQASALVQVQQRLVKLHERWDNSGIPEERVVA